MKKPQIVILTFGFFLYFIAQKLLALQPSSTMVKIFDNFVYSTEEPLCERCTNVVK